MHQNKETSNSSSSLSASIIFASLVIAGSLIFFGTQVSGGDLKADALQLTDEELTDRIHDGVDDYIKELQNQAAGGSAAPAKISGDFSDDDPFMGDKDAPITIVEFSDYECPFCARFSNNTLPELKKKYIDTGKVKIVYRDFPLSIHNNAKKAAMIAECVRDESDDANYFEMHDKIFGDLSQGVKYNHEEMLAFAGTLGVNSDKVADCVDSGKFSDEVEDDLKAGAKAGVSGTPGFIVGDQLISGAQPFSVFEKAIEAQLK